LDEAVAMTPGGIQLLHAGWLWLLPGLIVAALLWRYFAEADEDTGLASGAASSRHRLSHPLLHLIPRVGGGHRRHVASQVLLWIVLACLVLALSQPVRIGEQVSEPERERDIVFIVDTSLSMILRDYVLNGQRVERISLLKNLLKQFVHNLQGERISVIVFGETAHTLLPLTQDQQLLTTMISRISAGMVGRYNAMGDAIALAVREAGDDAGDKEQRNQILVLFTDAGQHTGRIEPQAAAQLAAEAGLPLYTVAIGASTMEAQEQRKYSGLLYQTVDTALLDTLAQVTHGNSYQAGDGNALERVVADITRHEDNIADQQIRYVQKPLYLWPLIAGLILFGVFQLLRLLRSVSP
jgi:Ca-activated chloride channel family protein